MKNYSNFRTTQTSKMWISFLISFWINTAFAQETALDQDFDNIPDTADLCPHIPANGSFSGCPIFERRTSEKEDNTIKIQWLNRKNDLHLHEKTELQPGDILLAVIKNPDTGEVYSSSEEFDVMN